MKLETAIIHFMADITPGTLRGMVDALGGSNAAAALLTNPKTGGPVAPRTVNRWLDYEKNGKTPHNRKIGADYLAQLQKVVPLHLMGKHGLLIEGPVALIDPSGNATERDVHDPETGRAIYLDPSTLEPFLDALRDDDMGAALGAFSDAVMEEYGFPGAQIDAGGSAVAADFTISLADV